MKKHTLLQTNLVVCTIITIGFIVISIIGYKSNIGIYEEEVEHISTLAANSVYYQIDKILSEPINVSLTMANDSLLKTLLAEEEENMADEGYADSLKDYLNAYKNKYNYDSVFLVSTATGRYYHFKGIDRVLTPDNPENVWYYDFLDSPDEYSMNIDNDEARDNLITVFVNCKIYDENRNVMGIVGAGLTVNSLQALLREYDEEYDMRALLVDSDGILQLSSENSGYEHISLTDDPKMANLNNDAMLQEDGWVAFWHTTENSKVFIVAQYIETLKWRIIVEKDMTAVSKVLNRQLFTGIVVAVLIIIMVLLSITLVLKKYRDRIVAFGAMQKDEYKRLLDQLTSGIHESIFEIDVTHNHVSGESAERYSNDLGLHVDTPYDEAIAIVSSRIKEEYAKTYLELFSPDKIVETYKKGINNISYDFLMRDDTDEYHWIRIIGRIFYWPSDDSIRMISYRQNIDEEKARELQLLEQSQRDLLTELYNKGTTEKNIIEALNNIENGNKYALLLFDIDNFKTVNDVFGHPFGDTVISEFAAELKGSFHDSDIIGRIGGDEFAVLIVDFIDVDMLGDKLKRFCAKILKKNFGKDMQLSCSIGAAIYPDHADSYAELYEKADKALYCAKAKGKATYHITEL